MLVTIVALMLATQGPVQAPLKLVAPATVDVTATSWCSDVPVSVVRPDNVEGTVVWTVRAPEGVRGTVLTSGAESAKVALRGFCDEKPGNSTLVVEAKIGARRGTATITLVRGQAKVLLVDDDRTANNQGSASVIYSGSDTVYRQLLLEGDGKRSLVYDTVAVESYSDGPKLPKMQNYDTIVWYTGGEYGGNPGNSAVVSDKDFDNLSAWLTKGKTLIVFSPGTLSNLHVYFDHSTGSDDRWTKNNHPFLNEKVGIKGTNGMLHRFEEIDILNEDESVAFRLAKGKPVETQVGVMNPSKATPLFWVELNPDGKGRRVIPCAVTNVTEKGSVVFIGFSFENIAEKKGDAFRRVVTPVLGWPAQ